MNDNLSQSSKGQDLFLQKRVLLEIVRDVEQELDIFRSFAQKPFDKSNNQSKPITLSNTNQSPLTKDQAQLGRALSVPLRKMFFEKNVDASGVPLVQSVFGDTPLFYPFAPPSTVKMKGKFLWSGFRHAVSRRHQPPGNYDFSTGTAVLQEPEAFRAHELERRRKAGNNIRWRMYFEVWPLPGLSIVSFKADRGRKHVVFRQTSPFQKNGNLLSVTQWLDQVALIINGTPLQLRDVLRFVLNKEGIHVNLAPPPIPPERPLEEPNREFLRARDMLRLLRVGEVPYYWNLVMHTAFQATRQLMPLLTSESEPVKPSARSEKSEIDVFMLHDAGLAFREAFVPLPPAPALNIECVVAFPE